MKIEFFSTVERRLAMCLSSLFAGNRNILTYLRRSSSKNELKKTKLEILEFLNFFVETASNKIIPYSIDLKNVLMTIFSTDNASDVRAAVFPILNQVRRDETFFDVKKNFSLSACRNFSFDERIRKSHR